MRNIITLLSTLFLSVFLSYGQVNSIEFTHNNQLVSGTIKTSVTNLKNEVLIKNQENKEEIYKLATISNVKINGEQYVAYYAPYDANLSNNISNLDYTSEPNFTKQWLLLKVLVSGDYTLYQFYDNSFYQFYYKDLNTSEIKPLIYKKYQTSQRQTKNNNYFRRQLRQEVPLSSYAYNDYFQVEYSQSDLMRYFNKLNDYDENKGVHKASFKFSVLVGYQLNDIQGKRGRGDISVFAFPSLDYNLEEKAAPFVGVSGEIIVDKKEQHAFFAELTYSQYQTNYYLDYLSEEWSKIDFRFKTNIFIFNLGYKRYFNLSPNSQLYASGGFSMSFLRNSENYTNYNLFSSWHNSAGEYFEKTSEERVNGSKSLSDVGGKIAIGYKFKKRYFVEANYRAGLTNSENIGFTHNSLSFVAGYTF